MKKQCKQIKKDGKRCAVWAIQKDGYCFFHSPLTRELHQKAVLAGGNSQKKERLGLPDTFKVRSSKDLKVVIERILSNISHAGIPTNPSSLQAIAKLTDSYMKLEEKAEVHDKVLELERRAAA